MLSGDVRGRAALVVRVSVWASRRHRGAEIWGRAVEIALFVKPSQFSHIRIVKIQTCQTMREGSGISFNRRIQSVLPSGSGSRFLVSQTCCIISIAVLT